MTTSGVPVFNGVSMEPGDSPIVTVDPPANFEKLYMTVQGIPEGITSIEVKLVANPGSDTQQVQTKVNI